MVHDVYHQVWPADAFIATGVRVIAGPTIVDPVEGEGRRVEEYGGYAELALPSAVLAAWVVQSYHALLGVGALPVIEVDWREKNS